MQDKPPLKLVMTASILGFGFALGGAIFSFIANRAVRRIRPCKAHVSGVLILLEVAQRAVIAPVAGLRIKRRSGWIKT